MKKSMLFLSFALVLFLACPLVQAERNGRVGGIEEFNYFKHFDRKENLIHLLTEFIDDLNHLPEDPAYVKEGQMIRWGCEAGPYADREELQALIEYLSSNTVFKIDDVAVDGWYYTDPYFFESWDHDGDGPGDGDGDGIGDAPEGYHSAFRYSTYLSVGIHTWSYDAVFSDSGTIIVLP